MGYARSQNFGLPGNNRIWMTLEWGESVDGTQNRVTVKMRIYTLYRINGTWTCRLKIEGNNVRQEPKTLSWGSNSYGGSREVFNYTETFWYSGDKQIYIEGSILNMDYYSVNLGPGSIRTQTLTFGANAWLRSTNTPPPTPGIHCNNQMINGRYIAEDRIYMALDRVSDPQGDSVIYPSFCLYQSPGSNEWRSAGDNNNCVSWNSNNTVDIDITKYPRGSRFKIWGRSRDSNGAESRDTYVIDNIYRNRLPDTIGWVNPNQGIINDDKFRITWPKTYDPDGSNTTYCIWCKKNNGEWINYWNNKDTTEHWEDIRNDPEGTTYQYKICTSDGFAQSAPYYTNIFSKNIKPTIPTQIFPNAGYYLGKTTIVWNSSIDPEGQGIDHYDIYINGNKVGVAYNNQFDWEIPGQDSEGTSYRISIVAFDKNGRGSERGTATGDFLKAGSPIAPTWISPQEKYQESIVKLKWKNVSSNGVATKYSIDCKINNGEWINIINSIRETEYEHNIEYIERGSSIVYRIKAINTFSQESNYTESMEYVRNILAKTPLIVAPINNGTIFNPAAKLLIKVFGKNNGVEQTVIVKINDNIYTSDKNTDMFSNPNNNYKEDTQVVFKMPNLNIGVNRIEVYCNDGLTNNVATTSQVILKSINFDADKNQIITAALFNQIISDIKIINDTYELQENLIEVNNKKYIDNEIVSTMQSSLKSVIDKINAFDSSNIFDIDFKFSEAKDDTLISYIYIKEFARAMEVI